VLGPQADAERQRIRQQFETGTSARETLRAQCELADRNVQQIFAEVLRVHDREPQGFACWRWEGTGGACCFPTPISTFYFCWERKSRAGIAAASSPNFRGLCGDIGFRVSSAGRTLEECKRIEEDNAEFHLALLDRRFLAGDAALFEKKLDHESAARVGKAGAALSAGANSQADQGTIGALRKYDFHLEPNVKESPGGMRDYQATIWLRQVVDEKKGIRNITAAEEELSVAAVDFLSAIRCFLHYSNGRNDNTLTYELQAAAGRTGAGRGGRRGAISRGMDAAVFSPRPVL